MANESHSPAIANAPAAVSQSNPTAALFQKAHAKLVTLSRIDEQLQSMFDQRRKLQDELRDVQAQINGEFDRVIRDAQEAPAARLAAQFSNDQAAKLRRNGIPKETLRLEVAEAV